MKTYKIQTGAGDHFSKVSQDAKELANEHDFVVEFDFNNVICLVDSNTDLDALYRDYSNSWIMSWKTIGPNCVTKYHKNTQAKLEQLTKIKEEKAEKQAEEYRKKEVAEKELFNSKVEGVELNLSDIEYWKKSRETNSDGYGGCVLDYAEGWAKLMQVEIEKGNKLSDIAEKTSFELDFLGITGFMYGCAVNILSHCWIYGEELRKWHNKQYGQEGEGVVNPAVLTISSKE